jgi:hypothetical protein
MIKEKDVIVIEGKEYHVDGLRTVGTAPTSSGDLLQWELWEAQAEYIILKKSKEPQRYIAIKQ